MTIRDATRFLVKYRMDTKVGAAVALLHAALIGLIVCSICFGTEAEMPMLWILAFLIDAPGGVFWLVVLPFSWLSQRRRRTLAPPTGATTLASTLRHIPTYVWIAIALLGIATVLQLAVLLRVPLGPASSGDQVIAPLALFGGLGTFVWSDIARRIVRMVLPPAREPVR